MEAVLRGFAVAHNRATKNKERRAGQQRGEKMRPRPVQRPSMEVALRV